MLLQNNRALRIIINATLSPHNASPGKAYFFAGANPKSQKSRENFKIKNQKMKKIIVTTSLLLSGITVFCQQEENGTVYIKHAYEGKDVSTLKTLYSDTASYWMSGMKKRIPMTEAFKNWMSDFDVYDSIMQKPFGYPDYIHYKDQDQKIVQSWWTLSGKSKKTGETVYVPIVIFDDFNNDGKIVREAIYGDFSKWSQMGTGNEEQNVQKVLNDLVKALQTNDAAELDRIWADTYTFVGINGVLSSKAERLAAIKSGKLKYKSISVSNVKIQMYGDAAVATLNGEARFAPGNEKLDGKFATTLTFVKSNGAWVEVAAESVNIGK
jgi:hypothetical protein